MNLSRIRTLSAAAVLTMLLVSASSMIRAQTIYRSVNENGVVSFSDGETDGARELQVTTAPVRENAREEQRALIEQQLAVARVLEESRLARDAARTKRLEALAAAQPRTVYYREADRRYAGGNWGWDHRPGYPGYPGYPGHPIHPDKPTGPVHPIEPPQKPPSRPVPFPPQNFD